MFKKISVKIWLGLVLSFMALILLGFFSYRYYTQGSVVIQHIEHNTAILNQNQSEIENLLESNSKNFQAFENTLEESDFEQAKNKIKKMKADIEEISGIKDRALGLTKMLKKDSQIQDSVEVYNKSKEVLQIRIEFLENLYLVQQTQVCNLDQITRASEAVYLINRQHLDAENQDGINLTQLKKVITYFESVAKDLNQIRNCFNDVNEEYKTEQFLKTLSSDVEFFQEQADLFQEIRDGLNHHNTEQLESAKKRIEAVEQRNIKIFDSLDYNLAFQNIFQEVVLALDTKVNQSQQDYELRVGQIRSKYRLVNFL